MTKYYVVGLKHSNCKRYEEEIINIYFVNESQKVVEDELAKIKQSNKLTCNCDSYLYFTVLYKNYISHKSYLYPVCSIKKIDLKLYQELFNECILKSAL